MNLLGGGSYRHSKALLRSSLFESQERKDELDFCGRHSGKSWWVAVLVLALLFSALRPGLAASADKLPPRYREWLERDVAYIITNEEKQAFLKLTRDEDRDKFMEHFWELRNSTPGAPTNPYREEHYRRVEYANAHFGKGAGTEGWRTDQGRVYITLGEPQQKAIYYGFQKIRPMEIWFYSNANPALPPFFYVIFYQRDIGDFRLYSPYFDGPEKLVNTLRTVNDRLQSWKVIDQAAGREVARTTLSLIPDEPVDMETATSSLQSDVMLSRLRNLANDPLTKESLERRRVILESVTHRVIFGGEFLNVATVPLRDPDGNLNLHYVLRVTKPQDFAVAQASDDRYYYAVEVTARVFGPDHKLIFTQEKSVSHYVSKNGLERVKGKAFGYEGWLPLPPGKYKLEFLLTNKVTRSSYRAEKEVLVPEVPQQGMRLTEAVPFIEAETVDPAKASVTPFSAAGVRFTPLLRQELNLVPGEDLKFFYQIWAPGIDPRASKGKKLVIEYVYGRPGLRGDSKVVRDEVLKEQFDPAGSLLNGKKISTVDLQPGNYLLTINVTDPETQKKTYATLGFRVFPGASSSPAWDIYDEDIGEDVRKGVTDYQRGLCYLALGEKEQAAVWFRKAFEKDPSGELARAKLVDLYFARQAFAEVADLYARTGITGKTEEQTILRMAESFDKIGALQKAVQLLETALNVKTASGPLYLTLASYYQRLGDPAKAAELERKGKCLMAPASPTT